MACHEMKNLLMDFLYNEISAESEKLVRAHLQSCAACRNEYEALSRTSLTLKAWENEDPHLNLVFVRESKSWWTVVKEKLFPAPAPLWGKLATGFGLGLAAVFFVSALLNAEITFEEGKFSYRASLVPRQPTAIEVDSLLVMEIQRQSRELVNQMLLASQEQQRLELNRALAQFASEINRQRRNDLLLVGRGLEEVQQHTTTRLERADEMLNELFRTVNLPPNQ
ncbi:MAG: zf-HC2 domain-containing protein [candidate division KSB1 bacterium]|nr:zf-HC2 domain-containing protein [candidate division KSB1 bacterium]